MTDFVGLVFFIGLFAFVIILMPATWLLVRILNNQPSDKWIGALLISFFSFSLPFIGLSVLAGGGGDGPGTGLGEALALGIAVAMSFITIPLSLWWFFRCWKMRDWKQQ